MVSLFSIFGVFKMAKNHVQVGDTLSLVAPVGGVVNGMVYVIGALVVVASFTAADGELFEGHTVGVWSLPKTVANTPAQGAKAYWDAVAGSVTTTASGNTLIGVFTEAYAAGTTSANVKLGIVA